MIGRGGGGLGGVLTGGEGGLGSVKWVELVRRAWGYRRAVRG